MQNPDYSIAMPPPAGPSVTVLLERARAGDRDALATLLPMVYDECVVSHVPRCGANDRDKP